MPNGNGISTLYMNHELGFAATSSPVVDGAGNPVGPAYRGAFASKWTLDADGDPIKGERAYDTIWNENVLLGPAPDASNVAQMPRQFGRFCSGSLAGRSLGFDRPIYFTNEETGPAESFDVLGGSTVAIFDNELHVLPRLGHFAKENTVANKLGRLYSLQLSPGDPTGTGRLHVVYNADTILAAGGDVAISPDNVDASSQYLMINEDGTGASRPVMASKGRDASVWRFNVVNKRKPSKPVGVDASTATRVAELDPPGRDGVAVGAGIWETSGIIDASALFGANWWLSDVQAHSPTAAPAPGTVEDGQLFLLRPKS
jgi:hypothetical protein